MEKMKQNNGFSLQSKKNKNKKIFYSLPLFFALTTIFFLVFAVHEFLRIQEDSEISKGSECIPYNIKMISKDSNSVTFHWLTKKECISFMKYGMDNTELFLMATEGETLTAKNSHKVVVDKLKPDTVYYFTVVTKDGQYGIDGDPLVIETNSVIGQ